MITSFNKTEIAVTVAYALALGILSGAASAVDVRDHKLVTDTRGAPVKSGFGLCWRSIYDPPPPPSAECDPNYVAAVAPPAPVRAPVVRAVPAPAPVAPKQVAALPPPPAPKPAVEKLTLDADTLFDFDKATLRPSGRDALDAFVGKLGDISPETIKAVGHTDRIGTERYNQRLSEQRVATVKAYMVSKGVEANRISTEGRGETQPVTNAEDCIGPKSAKVIACLQPDRRVELEVIGTRIVR